MFFSAFNKKIKSSDNAEKFLAQAYALEEHSSLYRLKRVTLVISALIVAMLVWCYFAVIPEVASATGEVVPQGRVHNIQHLDGGIVEAIFVRDGDIVEPGQVLIRLNQSTLFTELETLTTNKVDLELTLERLQSLIESRDPEFASFTELSPALVNSQYHLFLEQKSSIRESETSFATKIDNRKTELDSRYRQIKAIKEEVEIYQQNNAARQKLLKQGLSSRSEALETAARLASAKNRLAEIESEANKLEHEIVELKQEQIEFRTRKLEEYKLEKNESTRNLNIIQRQIANAQERLSRLSIRSQINGIVKGIQNHSVNEVIQAGETLMEIIPVGDELLIEARLDPDDIGHVVEGLSVEVKVNSYEHQKFGSISGRVAKVSATTHISEQGGEPYYKIEIKLDRDYVGDTAGKYRIVPGMIVQADIYTGEKTVMEYLLKPIHRGVDGAFGER